MGHYKYISAAYQLYKMKKHEVTARAIPSWYVTQCRAVSDAHICASYLSYLHHSTVVTVGLPPKQDWQPSPTSVSTLLSAKPYQPTPATLSQHFLITLSQCNPAPASHFSLCMPCQPVMNDASTLCSLGLAMFNC